MGERVAVGRVTPAEPVGDPRGGPSLDYGRGDRAGDAWRWWRAWGTAALESTTRLAQMLVAALGGWRRVFFAFGLACLLGGLGDCLDTFPGGEGAFWMFVGGLLVGFTLRIPLLDGGRGGTG